MKSSKAARKPFIAILRTFAPALILAAAATFLDSCAQKEDPTAGTFQSVWSIVNTSNCVTCHRPGGSGTSTGTTLDASSSSTLYATIFNLSTISGGLGSGCGSNKYVQPGNPSTSVLLGILFSDYGGGNQLVGNTSCHPANSVHSGYVNLTSTEESSIVAWIQGGALNN